MDRDDILALEQRYRDSLDQHRIPEHLREGLIGHVVHGHQTGGFLYQVLCDHLAGSVTRAGADLSLADIIALAKWLYNETPAPCWGSEKRVNDWKARGGEVSLG